MADILDTAVWFEADGSNGSGTQPSWPENMPAKNVNNAARAMQGALARWAHQICATLISGGTGAAYTLTYTVAPAALYDGQRFCWIPNVDNTGACTVNINALGAKDLKKMIAGVATALSAGDVKAGAPVDMIWNVALNTMVYLNVPTTVGLAAASTTDVLTGTDSAKYVTADALAALWEKGADVASAATISLGEGGLFNITGTTNISDIDFATPKDGRMAVLILGGNITLVHSATLSIPGFVNYSGQSGDRILIMQTNGDTILVLNIQRWWMPPNTFAGTADVLAGTDTSLMINPDVLAAIWEKGADVASAATVALGDGAFFHITGTVTITDIDWSVAKNGRMAVLEFDGALTLTHNATSLVLPGGKNIITEAGDIAVFIQDAADNVHCVNYQRKNAVPPNEITIYKAADETRTSTTVLANDADFVFTGKTNTTYDFEMFLSATISGTTNGFKWDLNGTVASMALIYMSDTDIGGKGIIDTMIATAVVVSETGEAAATRYSLWIRGYIAIGGADQTIRFRWAQQASSATPTTLRKESWLKYRARNP